MAERYGATRFIKTQHKLLRAAWDADRRKWSIRVERTNSGDVFEEDCDVLIAARGLLNEPAWPNVPGLETFRGKLLHSGEWDDQWVFIHPLAVSGGDRVS